MNSTRFPLLFRALSSAALLAGRERAIALYGGLLIVVGILFGGPNSMRASDVTYLMATHLPERLVLWTAWLVAAAPLARAILVMPSTFLLRSLPIPAWQLAAVHAAHLGLIETPWLVLGLRGEGVASGLTMAATAAGLHALIVAPPRHLTPLVAGAALAGIVIARPPVFVALPLGAAFAAVAIFAAWQRAPELQVASAPTGSGLARRLPALALTASYIVVVWRAERALLARALIVTLIGAGAAAAAVGNNAVTDLATIVRIILAVETPALAIAAMAIATGVAACERREGWLLDAVGATAAARRGATLMAASLLCVCLGAGAGVLAARGAGVVAGEWWRLGAMGALMALTLAAVALATLRAASTRAGAESRFALGAMALATVLLTAASAIAGPLALVAAPLAIALALAPLPVPVLTAIGAR